MCILSGQVLSKVGGVRVVEAQMARVVVLLSDRDDRRFGAYCKATGHKKSPLIARLIRDFLDREGFAFQPSLFETPVSKSAESDAPSAKHARKTKLTRS